MKKRIILLLMSLLLISGCTCEYNLNISNDNIYSENIIITPSTSEEKSDLNKDWQIPVDIDEFNIGRDSNADYDGEIYNYNITDKLNLKYTYTNSRFKSSTAANICFSDINISNYEEYIVISSTEEFLCFDKYPDLTNVKINITIEKEVISNNADSVNDNTYTWNISKNDTKSINLILDNRVSNDEIEEEEIEEITTTKEESFLEKIENSSYLVAIFLLVIILIAIIGYFICKKLKEKNDKLDD